MANSTPTTRGPRERNFLILAAVTFALLLAAVAAVLMQRDSESASFGMRLAFETLEEEIEGIGSLRIRSAESELTMVRGEDFVWRLKEAQGFPVVVDQIRQTVLSLTDLKLVEAKTARADWHHHLGLVRPEEGGDGVVVGLYDRDGKEMASLVVGHVQGLPNLSGETRRYVRLANEAQTWVALGRLEPVTEKQGWLDLEFLTIDRARIREVRTKPGKASKGDAAFSASRDTADIYDFALHDVPPGYEATAPSVANGVASALMALSLQDVRPASEVDFSGATIVVYDTFDGLELALKVAQADGDFWITMGARALPTEDVATDSESKPGAEPLESEIKANPVTHAQAINRSAQDWAFKIPEWKGNQLTVALDSLIKPIGQEEPTEN